MLNSFDRLTKLWQHNFSVYTALDAVSAEIRGKHLSSILRVAPFTLGANVANGALILLAFWDTSWMLPVLCWLFSLMVITAIGARAWWVGRKTVIKTASPHAIRRSVWHAVYIASIWGLMPALLFTQATPTQQVLIATIIPGMMGGGAFVLAPVPLAGLAYLWVITLPSLFAVLSTNNPWFNVVAGLLLIYAGVVSVGVWSAAKTANARLRSEREAERQSQMVSLLLRDFEDQTSDVLWEINIAGQFTHVTHKLAALLNQRPSALTQTTLQDWFKAHCKDLSPLEASHAIGQTVSQTSPARASGRAKPLLGHHCTPLVCGRWTLLWLARCDFRRHTRAPDTTAPARHGSV